MFSGLWAKLTAFMGVVIAGLLFLVGYRGRKIDKLEHDAKIKDEIKSIHEQQDKDEKGVLNNEPTQIKEEIEKRTNLDRANRIKRL